MNNPRTPKYLNTPVVWLTQSEGRQLADAADRVIAEHGSRKAAASELGVTDSALQTATSRSASIAIRRGLLDKLGGLLGVETKGWGA